MNGTAARKASLVDRVAAAVPFSTLVRREFVRMLRRTRPFVFLLLLACIAGILVAGNYPPAGLTPVAMGSYNESMVSSLVASLFIAALVLLPAYGAASIQSERARNTYDFLSLSLIRPSGIVFAKIVSTLGYFFLLVIAVLPFLGVSFFLLGVDWQTIIQSGIVVLVAAVTCATVGVLASAYCRGPVAAVILAYVFTFVFIGGYLIALAIVAIPVFSELDSGWNWLEPVAIFVVMTSPVCAIIGVLSQDAPGWAIFATVVGQGIVWVFAIRVAAIRLRKPDEPPQPIELDELSEPGERTRVGISARLAREPIKDGVNPVRVRELRWGSVIGGDRGLAIIGLAATLLLFINIAALGAVAPFDSDSRIETSEAQGAIFIWLLVSMAAGSLIAAGAAAVSLTTEADTGNLDGLLMTTLKPQAILHGKTAAVVVFSVLPLIFGGLIFITLARHIVTELETAVLFLTGLVSLGITVLLCTAIGVWVSARAKSTGMALMATYGLVGLVTLGPLFLHAIVDEWSHRLAVPELYEREMLFLHPVTNYAVNLSEFESSDSSAHLLVWFICAFFHLAGVALIYYLAERRFVRMVTRGG